MVLIVLASPGTGYWPLFPLLAATGVAAVALLERLAPFEPAWTRDHDGDLRADVLHFLVSHALIQSAVAIGFGLRGLLSGPVVAWPVAAPMWVQVLLAGAIMDLGLYAMHRWSHVNGRLWRLHAIHHSPRRLYWLNGGRRHALSALVLAAPGLVVLLALGVTPIALGAWMSVMSIHLAFQHANLDYRWARCGHGSAWPRCTAGITGASSRTRRSISARSSCSGIASSAPGTMPLGRLRQSVRSGCATTRCRVGTSPNWFGRSEVRDDTWSPRCPRSIVAGQGNHGGFDMDLTSEQVHWLYGAALSAFGLLLVLHVQGRIGGRWPEFAYGGALLVAGAELVADRWLHGTGSSSPAGAGSESAQHLALGIGLVLCAAGEIGRAATRRTGRPWRAPLAVALAAAGLTFLLHAQHAAAVPMLMLVVQHRFIAATLFVLAAGVLLAPAGSVRQQGLAVPLLALLLGLQFLAYSEGNSPFGVPAEHQGTVQHK